MSDHNSSTEWPIIVGATYKFQGDRSDVVGRVTAIAGDVVFWTHKWVKHESASEVGQEFGAREWTLKQFRMCFRPEDQSPIPSLVKALKAIQFKGHNQVCPICKGTENSGHGLMCDIGVALVLAGEPTEDSNAG